MAFLLTSNNKFGICDTTAEGHNIITNMSGNGAFVMYVRNGDMIYTFLSKTSSATGTPVSSTAPAINPDTTTPITTEATTTTSTTSIMPDFICDKCGYGFMDDGRIGTIYCPLCGYVIYEDYSKTTSTSTVTPTVTPTVTTTNTTTPLTFNVHYNGNTYTYNKNSYALYLNNNEFIIHFAECILNNLGQIYSFSCEPKINNFHLSINRDN